MELIDKSVVLKEIERRAKFFLEQSKNRPSSDDISCSTALYGLLSFFENLKTKEVDLENSVKGRIDYPLIGADFPNIYPNYKELKDYCDKNGIKDDDKVKIIIIKDE